MARFDKAIALAQRQIKKNGELAILRRRTDSALPDASKPWRPGVKKDTDTIVSMVFLDESVARMFGMQLKHGQQLVLIAGGDLTSEPDPAMDTIVRASGTRMTIDQVKTLQPNGQQVLHVLSTKN